jgi:RNA polymerase primary sigma factor
MAIPARSGGWLSMQIPSPPHPSIDPGEWQLLLESRSGDNTVEPNNVAHVLRKVELSEDVLHVVEKALVAAGVTVSHVEPELEPLPERKIISRRSGESSDPMKMYLQEIGQVDLLTAEQERTLGRQIQEMLVAKQQLDNGSLTVAEKRRLRGVVHTGEAAREHLITANLRLVVSIARRYDGKGLQLPDLIQEGNIGLMRAAEKYDWEKGFKFSTYATWWIRQAMMRAMADQGRTIRVPSHVVELLHRIAKAERELTVELEREPTLQEIAHRTMLEPERIMELRQISSVTISLDAPVGNDDDSQTWSDRVSSDDVDDSPVEHVQRKMLMDAITHELQALPERDRRILEKRFGIQNGKPQTLDDVAKEEGVTRERVRQIEQKTLARMRHPNNSRKLRSFLDDIG